MKNIILICFSFTFLFISKIFGQDQSLIYKIAKINALTEKINSLPANTERGSIDFLFSFVDSLPIEIFDHSSFANIIFGKVGIPLVKLEMEAIKIFFQQPNKEFKVKIMGNQIDSWKGYAMVVFAIDLNSLKMYKLNGFKNYDIMELIDDLKTNKIVKNHREFLLKSAEIKEINFKQVIKQNNKSYKYSALSPVEIFIYSDKKGNDKIKFKQ